MIIQSLNGKWTLTIPGAQFHDIPAEVPGSVYHDLLRESLIPDPFYRDNEDEATAGVFLSTLLFCPAQGFCSAVTAWTR